MENLFYKACPASKAIKALRASRALKVLESLKGPSSHEAGKDPQNKYPEPTSKRPKEVTGTIQKRK